jgi:hypothetical protein
MSARRHFAGIEFAWRHVFLEPGTPRAKPSRVQNLFKYHTRRQGATQAAQSLWRFGRRADIWSAGALLPLSRQPAHWRKTISGGPAAACKIWPYRKQYVHI